MKRYKIVAQSLLFLVFSNAQASEETISFSPNAEVKIKLDIQGTDIFYEILSPLEEKHGNIQFETEKIHVVIEDFNFDGEKDLSTWYIDDGMGTYTIHRVFLYDPKSSELIEHFPRCGDEFINLTTDITRKRLVSTYYYNNTPKSCITKLPKYTKEDEILIK